MMKKVLFLLFVLISPSAFSQRSEVGVLGGVCYYLGDLNPSKHFGNSQPAFGVVYRYNLNLRWALKFNGIYGKMVGDDASSVGFDKFRNLSFRSNVMDFSGQIELNFLPYFTGSQKYIFSPYIFTGIAVYTFNPQAEYQGEWYDLQPLATEGQGTTAYPNRTTYNLTQFAIPFGMGVKVSLSKLFCLGAEWSMRKTFTDYLDDVSTTYVDPVQLEAEKGPISAALSNRSLTKPGDPPIEPGKERGNSSTKDWYSFAGITLTMKIVTKKDHGCRDFREPRKYNDYYSNE
jgi:hypothetical protein